MESPEAAIGDKIQERFGKNFLLLSAHTGLSRTGTSAFSIAVVWIALTLTSSPVVAGFADGFISLPLFFSFIFGAYIDTIGSKKKLAMVSAGSRALAVLLLIFAVVYDSELIRIVAIYSVSFLLGMTSDILNSIRASWAKQFLSEEQYKKGSSLIETTTAMAQSVGFAFSGVMLTLGDYYTTYAISAIFMSALIPLFRIKDYGEGKLLETRKESFRNSLAEGLSFISGNSFLKAAIIITLFVNLAFGAVGILFADLIDYEFNLPAIFFAIFFLTITIGIVLGSVSGSKIKGKIGFFNAIFIFTIGALITIIPFMRNVYPDYAIALLIGFLIGVINVISETGLLKVVKQDMLARVIGAISTFALTITFLSGGIGGTMIGIFTLKWSFVIIGVIISCVAILSISFKEYYNVTV